ncbi:MAG: DUF423 domain-containing protein [Phycisphaerae bacterium]
MNAGWVKVAAAIGALSVGLGAFGAHGLKGKIEPEKLANFETAVRYQMYHALALLATAWYVGHGGSRWSRMSAWSFLIGVLFFSGSIYGLTFTTIRWFIPFTPAGGLLLMLGWVFLGLSSRRSNRLQTPSTAP